MIRPSLALLVTLLFVVSCASGPKFLNEAPEWIGEDWEDTSEYYAFRGRGTAESLALAKEEAIQDLYDSILEAMNLGDASRWSSEGLAAINIFRDELEKVIRTPELHSMDGVSVVHKDGWKTSGEGITYALDIRWESGAFERINAELAELVGVVTVAFKELGERAVMAEAAGNVYEAALIWAKAAGIAENDGNISGYRQALRQTSRVLEDLEFSLISAPETVAVGLRPSTPIVFLVSFEDRPVGNAEFVVTYSRILRDGSPGFGEVRILSDDSGYIRFLPPEISMEGMLEITVAPSADPFLEHLNQSGGPYADALILEIEAPRFSMEIPALTRSRSIPMGILVLETDLAGNPLNSNAAADGLLDDLVADGFNVTVIYLDPQEMLTRNDKELLRDIKADEQFSSRYERIIHGKVTLESFEQNGDAYSVRVSGILSISDIQRQIVVYRSEIAKTSRASDGQQAINAAFRQLGRSFAEELIAQAP